MIKILQGDVLKGLAILPDESVHCVVTSPPYWGLRDYQVDGQIGLEATPEEYVEKMVTVFREVRRVLRRDGVVFLNMGDCYAGSMKGPAGGTGINSKDSYWHGDTGGVNRGIIPSGLKPKDLVGMPWRVAFALQADGWVLRSDIIWSKNNPMPESVLDRPTKSHEYLFLLSKAKWTGNGEPPIWINEVDKAWLAALVDGEGTICFQERISKGASVPTYSIRLSVVNTNQRILERISEICNVGGGPGSPSPRDRRDGSPGKSVYCWQITNSKAAIVIAAIRPYLIIKAIQADLALSVHILNQKHKGKGGYTTSKEDDEFKRKAAVSCSNLNCGRETDLSWFTPLSWGHWVSQPYMYDADAIREKSESEFVAKDNATPNISEIRAQQIGKDSTAIYPVRYLNPAGRNRRTVWEIPTQPFPEAHFATFPEALVEPCIKAGTSERGCCPKCGAPWKRETKVSYEVIRSSMIQEQPKQQNPEVRRGFSVCAAANKIVNTINWSPTCICGGEAVPCIVLDPFAGSGTVAKVARDLGRSSVMIELSPAYIEIMKRRLRLHEQLFGEFEVVQI